MSRILPVFVLVASIFAASPSRAVCPELTGIDLAYYICPGMGAKNTEAQWGIVYKRASKPSIWDVCSGIKDAVSKATLNSDKHYAGHETEMTPGTLVCDYELPESWKTATHEFSVTATIDGPHIPAGALCPSFTFDEMGEVLCGAVKTSFGIDWKSSSQGVKDTVCSFLKGAVSKLRSTPQGKIYGQLGRDTHGFSHTCSYIYHKGEEEATLTLRGTQDLEHLRDANRRMKERHE